MSFLHAANTRIEAVHALRCSRGSYQSPLIVDCFPLLDQRRKLNRAYSCCEVLHSSEPELSLTLGIQASEASRLQENGQCEFQLCAWTGDKAPEITGSEIKGSLWLCHMIRHVKCDEKKPVCDRCANAGYECDGYCYNSLARRPSSNPALPPGTTIKNSRVAIPRAQSVPNTRIVVQPSAGPGFKTAIEHRYFLVFQESASAQLSGYYESSVWDRVVLQACHEEQWARNVVVAIGALHQTLETPNTRSNQSHETPEGERQRKSHYIFALQHYGKALGQLSNISGQESQSESRLRHALISSLLTTCFETYIGNRENAFIQAKAGIDLLIKWTARQHKVGSDDSEDEWSYMKRIASRSPYLHADLLGAFERLDYQLLLCQGFQPGRKAPRAFPNTSRPFTCIKEACLCWDMVMRRILHFHVITDPRTQHSSSIYYDDENGHISLMKGNAYSRHAEVERINFTTATEQFFRHFKPVFESSRRRPGTKEYFLANLVMIRALCARAAVSQGPTDSETYADAFLRDYILAIELARELIDNAKTTLRKAVFDFDISLGCSIFNLANRCRDPKVRRDAIDLLLQFPQREGWFDGVLTAKIATWIMSKEEEGMVNGYIPDSVRLRLIKHEVGPQKQLVVLQVSKLVWENGQSSREVLPLVTITW